jgi:hypothetical protein
MIAVALAAGCTDSPPPPSESMSALGEAVGDDQPDTLDFAALLDDYASDAYQGATQAEQARYQLFLAAKAAQLVADGAEDPGLEMEEDVSGDEATVTYTVLERTGVFAVADVSIITVHLVATGDAGRPWRIDTIELTR